MRSALLQLINFLVFGSIIENLKLVGLFGICPTRPRVRIVALNRPLCRGRLLAKRFGCFLALLRELW